MITEENTIQETQTDPVVASTTPELPHLDENYPHLLKDTALLLDASLGDRIGRVRADRFILHRHAEKALAAMKRTCASPNDVTRPKCLALIGDSNTGKSAVVAKFARDYSGHEPLLLNNDGYDPLLKTTLRPRATLPVIALGLAEEMNLLSASMSRMLTDNVLRTISKRHYRTLLINEFHHIAPIPRQERQVVYDFIKSISERGIHVIAVGTDVAREKLAEDEQINNRFRVVRLAPFTACKDLEDFLFWLESYYPLRKPSHLHEHAKFIVEKTGGVVGEIVDLCNDAAETAIKGGHASITIEMLEDALPLPMPSAA